MQNLENIGIDNLKDKSRHEAIPQGETMHTSVLLINIPDVGENGVNSPVAGDKQFHRGRNRPGPRSVCPQ